MTKQNKNNNNIFDLNVYLNFCVPLTRLLGLAPVAKKRTNKNMNYRPFIGLLYFLQVMGECCGISYLLVKLIERKSRYLKSLYSFDALEIFACIMFCSQVITMKLKLIEKRQLMVEAIDEVFSADKLLQKLDIKISYKKMKLFSKIFVAIFCVWYPVLLVLAFQDEAHFLALLLQIWRVTSINIFALFYFSLYIKYKKINKFLAMYIKENEEGIALTTNPKRKPWDVLNTIAITYDKLCTSGRKWNEINHSQLSINILFYSIGLTLYLIAYYRSPKDMIPMIPVCIYLFIEFCYILTISQITRDECQKLMPLLNDMTCCYVDDQLWTARNSVLLQTLHQKVNYTVLHVMPLDFTLAIKIGGIILSVLVLTIQIQGLQNEY